MLRAAGLADDAHVFVARRSGLADVRVMVATAWDLAAIEEQYERFIDDFRAEAPADLLARLLELVHAWRRFPSIDPVLPRELLPARWSGLAAAQLFADRRQRGRPTPHSTGSVSTTSADQMTVAATFAGNASRTCYGYLTQ